LKVLELFLIANSSIFKEFAVNFSRNFPFLGNEIKIPFQYGYYSKKTTNILNSIGREVAINLNDESRKNGRPYKKIFMRRISIGTYGIIYSY
jgi:hypothetical protein